MRYENRLRIGQIWKKEVYDVPFAWVKQGKTRNNNMLGYHYYEITEKQSGGMWLPKYLFSIIKGKYTNRISHTHWVKGTEIQQDMILVKDPEASTIRVLFGNIKGSCPAEEEAE